MAVLWRIFRLTARYPWRAFLTFILAVLGTLLVLVLPGVSQRFIDDAVLGRKAELILPLAGIGLAGIFGRQILFVFRTLLNNRFEQLLIHDLRRTLYDRVQRLPLRWFDKQPTGDILTRLGNDVPAMERVIVEGIDQGLTAVIQFVLVVSYLMHLHAGLTLITLAPMPLIAIATMIYSKKAGPRSADAQRETSALTSLLHDNIAGIRQVKAYTREPEELKRFDEASLRLQRANARMMRTTAFYWPSMSLLGESGVVIMLASGSWWAIQNEIKPGVLSAFLFSWGLLYDPISRVGTLSTMFINGGTSGKRVFDILDLTDEPNLTEGERPEKMTGLVKFENVGFSYSDKAPTIAGITLEALPGQTIAFVGPTGAGKSTLLNLLTRFYEYDTGRILLDDHAVHDLSKEWLRDHVGYCTQESFLFNTSVRENLLLARPEATEEEIWSVLRLANADAFVKRMENGLDTVCGERGVMLSGGERQRLSIARVLLKNPAVLLLDEATSAMDNETERLIQQALDNLRANRTCFVIAHRLSTVRDADLICVLEAGRIVERGTHDELMAQSGLYARLASTGFTEKPPAAH